MANYCFNYMEISVQNGDDREKIIDFFKSYDDFKYFTHWGDSISDDKVTHVETHDDVYKYGTRYWDFELETDKDVLVVRGDSAWAPPTGIAEVLTKAYDCTIRLEYDEPGMNFAGIEYYRKGSIYQQTRYDSWNQWDYTEGCPNFHVERILENIDEGLYDDDELVQIMDDHKYLSDEHKKEVKTAYKKRQQKI